MAMRPTINKQMIEPDEYTFALLLCTGHVTKRVRPLSYSGTISRYSLSYSIADFVQLKS
jgi:hypothetical protein